MSAASKHTVYMRRWRAVRKAGFQAGAYSARAEKRCPHCGLVKLASEWTINFNHPDGLATWCKACCRIEQRERAERNRALIRAAKEQPCAECGVRYPYYVMDLDHRDPESKVDKLSAMVSLKTERVIEELAKCDAVCANCHRLRGAVRGGWV